MLIQTVGVKRVLNTSMTVDEVLAKAVQNHDSMVMSISVGEDRRIDEAHTMDPMDRIKLNLDLASYYKRDVQFWTHCVLNSL